ncbi:MAG: peroxide stress protein YaaA [Rickettsiales bacterium]|nr:peroxide stress protein YaaA [Rickettsiales bacterium]
MLIVLSPSKTLDYDSVFPDISTSLPRCFEDTLILVKELRNYSSAQIAQLMDISVKLSDLNMARYQNFSTDSTRNNSRPSLFAFKGDVYAPMDISQYGKKELGYAQGHVRILSGLYGLLRPLDLMQPYRLEMGTGLKTKRGKDLYQFWGDRITQMLNEDVKEAGGKVPVVVNLASEEYFKAVRPELLEGEVIHIVFKERTAAGVKIIGIHAKKARGLMADFAIKGQVKESEKLKKFNGNGYAFQPKLSTENSWVFVR